VGINRTTSRRSVRGSLKAAEELVVASPPSQPPPEWYRKCRTFSYGAHALVERGAHIDAHRFQRGGAVGSELVEERVEGGGVLARRRGRLQLLAAGSAGALQTADRGRRGRRRLLYLKVDPALLRQRLDERNRRSDANAAFPITQDLLTSYLAGFEEPNGEGEEALTSPSS